MAVGYIPNEGDGEVREFLDDLDRVVDRVGNGIICTGRSEQMSWR